MLDTPENFKETIRELNEFMKIDPETEEKYKDVDFSYLDGEYEYEEEEEEEEDI